MVETTAIGQVTMQTIEAVIFDWGGVLIDDPRPALMRYCAKTLGVSEEDYAKAHNKFMDDFQRGSFSEETFWTKICGELNTPVSSVKDRNGGRSSSLWGDAFRAAYLPRADVFSVVTRLKKMGYRTALLSNAEVPAMQFFGELQYDMFDVAVFSCAEGMAKPDRRIYEITVDRLDCQSGQAVFIDDRPENINGAKETGLSTILFRDIEQVKKELSRLSVKTS
jgi:putative hydrolase of the HAD superfamily